jgi:putative tricarboxylic transport membrane protein
MHMIDFTALGSAMAMLGSDAYPWIWIIPGLLTGMLFGALPGVSVTMALALCLPMTLYMPFLPAIVFLTSVYSGANFGGSVPAILVNMPGTSAAVATCFDGYAMARQGRHNQALGAALSASALGDFLAYLVLLLMIVPISVMVMGLGPMETLGIGLWGLLMIGSLTGTSWLRGLFAGALGVLIGTVGMNTVGHYRGTWGIPELYDGVSLIPALMGLLAVSQIFNLINDRFIVKDQQQRRLDLGAMISGMADTVRHRWILLRGAVIGAVIGAVPGVGASVANLLSYSEVKRVSPDPEQFGQGDVRGVIAAESANSSSEGGSMITMLSLGIPGGGATAVLLAAFAMHNMVVGPSFIERHRDMVYTIIINNMAQALLTIPLGLLFIYMASSLVKVPVRFIIPVVMIIAVFGSYAIDGSVAGPVTLIVFAMLGWLLSRHDYSPAAVVVGMLLGGLIEDEAIKSWQVSGGNLWHFADRPAVLVIFALLAVSVALGAWRRHRQK